MKNRKLDFKKAAMSTVIGGATAVVYQVLETKILPDDPKMRAGLMLAAGVVAPAFIKGDEANRAGTAVADIALYNLAREFDVTGKLGLDGESVSGIPGSYNIGARGWEPVVDTESGKKSGKKPETIATNVQ